MPCIGMPNIYAIMKEVLKMKYKQTKKQNQRILRITNETLVIGADISRQCVNFGLKK